MSYNLEFRNWPSKAYLGPNLSEYWNESLGKRF